MERVNARPSDLSAQLMQKNARQDLSSIKKASHDNNKQLSTEEDIDFGNIMGLERDKRTQQGAAKAEPAESNQVWSQEHNNEEDFFIQLEGTEQAETCEEQAETSLADIRKQQELLMQHYKQQPLPLPRESAPKGQAISNEKLLHVSQENQALLAESEKSPADQRVEGHTQAQQARSAEAQGEARSQKRQGAADKYTDFMENMDWKDQIRSSAAGAPSGSQQEESEFRNQIQSQEQKLIDLLEKQQRKLATKSQDAGGKGAAAQQRREDPRRDNAEDNGPGDNAEDNGPEDNAEDNAENEAEQASPEQIKQIYSEQFHRLKSEQLSKWSEITELLQGMVQQNNQNIDKSLISSLLQELENNKLQLLHAHSPQVLHSSTRQA